MFQLNRILRIVDLARPEDNSLDDCFELAEKFSADVHLLHVIPESSLSIFGSQKKISQSTEQMSVRRIPTQNVNVIREVRAGELASCIIEYVKELSIDLIVIDQADVSDREASTLVSGLREQLSIPILLTDSVGRLHSGTTFRATAALIEKFGAELYGDRQQALESMTQEVERALSLSSANAEKVVAQLEDMQLLTWRESVAGTGTTASASGYWHITEQNPQSSNALSGFDVDLDMERTAAVSLIQRAIEVHATDIHIDPSGLERYTVQFRIDGRMHEFCRLPQHLAGLTMKQIKLMANISLADPFHPSESRLEMPVSIPHHEVRVTTAPVADGEAIAMRIIDGRKLSLQLSEIGLSPQSYEAVYRMTHRSAGLVLIAGPTGAGKTTTAYSILNALYGEQQQIISIEDPVEMVVPFMRQLNVDEKHGFTMQAALATVLRMDPDAVFLGEIRNSEAAQVAFQAASCGKRAITTIHLKDVASTLAALKDFDVDSKTLADSISGVIAQRLVRRLCETCKDFSPLTEQEQSLFQAQNVTAPAALPRARGCPDCRGTGYKGRIGVFEAVVIEGEFADALVQELHVSELRQVIRKSGVGLLADGLHKVLEGITTIEDLQEAGSFDDVPLDSNPFVVPDERTAPMAP